MAAAPSSRRHFLAGAAALATVLSAPGPRSARAQEAAARPLVPRELFFGNPDIAWAASLRERSPLTHIDRAFRPILIAQGLQDVRVTRAESEQMVAALRRRDVPVTYITFRDEGHGFARPENQIAFHAITEAFLAKHLGGAAEPINRARDFKGSALSVEAGADLVPGLAG